ncbi:CCR4-NOT regulatory complex component [Kluyveromyces marxianus]|nr:CCR4-NOT regulatory complex component [Kluyveromyces marxianus]KAG0680082.1 CCR4-NOT regulatory complex component [Kluyveromyces marxianus]
MSDKNIKDNNNLAVEVKNLTYTFPEGKAASIIDLSLSIKWNKKVLVVGNNGAGKSTLLKLLSGKHLCLGGDIRVGGRNPFAPNNDQESVTLTTYLGTEWASMSIIHRDICVLELLESIGLEHYRERGERLIQILEVDTNWRMFKLSDGQKRRVQLCMGLMKPFKVLLLDEVTVDLDVVARDRLFQFLDDETKQRECTVVYATHIFDGLAQWADEVIHLQDGRIAKILDYGRDIEFTKDIEGVQEQSASDNKPYKVVLGYMKSLYPLALHWLSRDQDAHHAA